MAATPGPTGPDLIRDLLAAAPQFEYAQAVRLLRLSAARLVGATLRLHQRPRLALDSGHGELAAVESLGSSHWRITTNFFGLYGVASPLPAYYTEDLLAAPAARGFLDLLHDRLYALLFDVWTQPRLELRAVELNDAAAQLLLQSFSAGAPLRHARRFALRRRNAPGLAGLLRDAFGWAQVRIVAGLAAALPIPPAQVCRPGLQCCSLGVGAWPGRSIDAVGCLLRLRLTDLAPAAWRRLWPGATDHLRLCATLRLYLRDPFLVELEIELACGSAQPARCGGEAWSRLGLDTWLAPGPRCAPPRQWLCV